MKHDSTIRPTLAAAGLADACQRLQRLRAEEDLPDRPDDSIAKVLVDGMSRLDKGPRAGLEEIASTGLYIHKLPPDDFRSVCVGLGTLMSAIFTSDASSSHDTLIAGIAFAEAARRLAAPGPVSAWRPFGPGEDLVVGSIYLVIGCDDILRIYRPTGDENWEWGYGQWPVEGERILGPLPAS